MSVIALWVILAVILLGVTGFIAGMARGWPTKLVQTATVVSVITMIASVVFVVAVGATELFAPTLDITVPASLPLTTPEGVTFDQGPAATLAAATTTQISGAASGLSIAVRILLACSTLIGGATLFLVALIALTLARSIGLGDPFRMSATSVQRMSIVVLLGGILGSLLSEFGLYQASQELFSVTAWSMVSYTPDLPTDLASLGWPSPAPLELTIPFWPIGAAIGLALLAAVFRYGAILRADSAGLV